MTFPYETDLLKHHVRMHGWLPFCKKRLKTIRENEKSLNKRRLRYFTFCAVGAIDVLMLDLEKVILPSDSGFDTVVFFDKSPESIDETRKRIPGAIGFPGDFTGIVLLEDPFEDDIVDSINALEPPVDQNNDRRTRERQNLIAQRRNFIQRFPFDVINLDLEEFLFKPRDELPGQVINSMRKIFEWQKRKFVAPNHRAPQELDGFTFMFTTRIGPPNMSEEYVEMLRSYLVDNLGRNEDLLPEFEKRTGGLIDVSILQNNNFSLFFELAVPKVLAGLLKDTDWYVDPQKGIAIYEFKREPLGYDPYYILHMVMDVVRQNPPSHRRAPGLRLPNVEDAYSKVVRKVISEEVIVVKNENIEKDGLQTNLDNILARRRKYYPGG